METRILCEMVLIVVNMLLGACLVGVGFVVGYRVCAFVNTRVSATCNQPDDESKDKVFTGPQLKERYGIPSIEDVIAAITPQEQRLHGARRNRKLGDNSAENETTL